jgi:hypothetical protein
MTYARLRRTVAIWLCPELKRDFASLSEANAKIALTVMRLTAEAAKAKSTALTMEKIMHTLEDVLALVAEQKTKIDSLVALANGLHQKVKDALGATATPSMQMRIDQVFDAVTANAAEVQAAIDANTDAPTPETSGIVTGDPGPSQQQTQTS